MSDELGNFRKDFETRTDEELIALRGSYLPPHAIHLAASQVLSQRAHVLDIARYKTRPSCNTLFCLVYDPEHRIQNPRGLESDLSKEIDGLDVRVFVPKS